MKPASDIMQRIYAAADSLYEQNGHAAYPTVDAVRKTARVSMNDANAGMREWRRDQMARAVAPSVQVPSAILQSQTAFLAEIWQSAQTLAGESLATAQAAWDAERNQLESINKEIAEAFEAQAAELEDQRAHAITRTDEAENALASNRHLQVQLVDLGSSLAAAESDARRDAARLEEVELRTVELRQELERAYQELAAAHQGGRAAMSAHADELAAVRADARQTEATLRSELEASRQQQRDLMQIVSAAAGTVLAHSVSYNDKGGTRLPLAGEVINEAANTGHERAAHRPE